MRLISSHLITKSSHQVKDSIKRAFHLLWLLSPWACSPRATKISKFDGGSTCWTIILYVIIIKKVLTFDYIFESYCNKKLQYLMKNIKNWNLECVTKCQGNNSLYLEVNLNWNALKKFEMTNLKQIFTELCLSRSIDKKMTKNKNGRSFLQSELFLNQDKKGVL